jgi:hypothetical protein
LIDDARPTCQSAMFRHAQVVHSKCHTGNTTNLVSVRSSTCKHARERIHVHVKPERAITTKGGNLFFLGDSSDPVSAVGLRWIGKVWVSRWWWYRLYTDGLVLTPSHRFTISFGWSASMQTFQHVDFEVVWIDCTNRYRPSPSNHVYWRASPRCSDADLLNTVWASKWCGIYCLDTSQLKHSPSVP